MQIQPVDLTALVSVIMGVSIILIPVIGLTARFALKPTVEALSRIFEGRERDASVQMLERRVALLEQQLDAVESTLGNVTEAASFDAQLRGGPDQGQGKLPPSSGPSHPG